jgi:hypothetical protein
VASNASAILAGISGGGTGGTGLQFIATTGTALPTSSTATLNVAFRDMGLISENGLEDAVNESSTDVNAYGLATVARTIIKSSKTTFKITYLESNSHVVEVYERLAIDSVSVASDGSYSVTRGPLRRVRYATVFDVVDGTDHLRMVCPVVEVTNRDSRAIKAGEAIEYGVEYTAYPDSTGVAVYSYYKVAALGS